MQDASRSGNRDKGGRRSGIDRREFSYSSHIPERRSGRERRSGKDRRSGFDRRSGHDRRSGRERRLQPGRSLGGLPASGGRGKAVKR
ncbi:MAG TPA: hypothetical protein ENF92_06795 [Desulfobacteraceae bacterium]|nr:hypothetical protein [Desulfobacteraceae bacterium]